MAADEVPEREPPAARITQTTLPRNEPTPAVGFGTIVRPNGQMT